MKQMLIITIFMAVISVFGKTEAVRTEASHHKSSKKYGKADYFTLKNDINKYMLYFQRVNASAKRDSSLLIGLPQPNFWYGFFARGFMGVTVNNIKLSMLEPKSMKLWHKKDTAGLDVLFNFDGTKFTFRYYIRDNSPVLWIELIHDKTSDPAKKILVSFSCTPSFSIKNGGKPDPSYKRFILTASRKIVSPINKRGTFYLNSKDQYIIYGDDFYQPGENDPKSQGPCFLRPDWAGVKWLKIWFGNIYCASTQMELKPEVGTYRFAVFETKKRMANNAFIDEIKNNPAKFNFKETK